MGFAVFLSGPGRFGGALGELVSVFRMAGGGLERPVRLAGSTVRSSASAAGGVLCPQACHTPHPAIGSTRRCMAAFDFVGFLIRETNRS